MFGRKRDDLTGTAAPPFVLPAHNDAPVDLAAFRDQRRVLLAFYPEDDTPG